MRTELYPPIGLIEKDLFGDALPLETESLASTAPPRDRETNLEMPAFLADMVRRRVASQEAFPPAPLAAGQIRRLAWIPTASASGRGRSLSRSYGVLLGACLDGQCWSGWIVGQETDYAADRDVVLQEEDGPLSPEAAIVQTWNPVRLALRGDEAILGQLAPHRLAAVSRLSEGSVDTSTFVPSRPGRIGAWNLDDGTTVVTGTPLGDASDPRREYQALYGDLAKEITAAATELQLRPHSEKPSVFERLRQLFVRPAWTFGAMALVVAQGAWIALSTSVPPDDAVTYRSTAHGQRAGTCNARIRVIFKPQASYADVVILLRRIAGTLADGPSETGELWISLPNDQKYQEASGVLKLSPMVEAADIIPADKGSCSP